MDTPWTPYSAMLRFCPRQFRGSSPYSWNHKWTVSAWLIRHALLLFFYLTIKEILLSNIYINLWGSNHSYINYMDNMMDEMQEDMADEAEDHHALSLWLVGFCGSTCLWWHIPQTPKTSQKQLGAGRHGHVPGCSEVGQFNIIQDINSEPLTQHQTGQGWVD